MEQFLAVTPNSDQAFLREVDEELRRDQLASFWTRYGRWLIVALGVALIAFGGVLYWRKAQADAAARQGEQLQQAYDDIGDKPADSAKSLATLSASGRAGYRAVARFTQADVLLQKNDLKGAAAKLGEIVADPGAAQPFRDLALVRQTSIEFDTLKPEVVISRLRALAIKGNPWFGSAGEMVAAAYLRMNRRDLAGALFGQIASDEGVPATLKQRAVEMAGVLGVDAIDQSQQKKAS